MATKIELKNGHIMVKELKRKDADHKSESGLYIPEQVLEDEQVSQGSVVNSNSVEYKNGDTVLFHRVMPVDVNLKIGKDTKLEQYFFIKEQDVICKITEE